MKKSTPYEIVAAISATLGAVLLVFTYYPIINPIQHGIDNHHEAAPLNRYILGTPLFLLILLGAWSCNRKAQQLKRDMPEHKPYPLNVEGPFYVEDGCCLRCDLPRTLAPDMFKFNETNDHCYVYKQPKTEDELRRMVEAVTGAELACIRCRGHDKELLRLLKNNGCAAQCDHLEPKG